MWHLSMGTCISQNRMLLRMLGPLPRYPVPSGLMDRAAMPSDSPLTVVSSAQSKPSGCWGNVSSAPGDALSLRLTCGLTCAGIAAASSFTSDAVSL